MESSQPIELPNTSWGRTPLPLIGIDWLLKRKWDAIQVATEQVAHEEDLEKRQALIAGVEGQCRSGFVCLFAYYFFGYTILTVCRCAAQEYISHSLALLAECIAICIFGTLAFRRFRLVEEAQLNLWTAGGVSSLGSIVADFPASVQRESRSIGLKRLDLLIALLADHDTARHLTTLDRAKLTKYCAAAEHLKKYQWRWKLRALRLRDLLAPTITKAPVKRRNG